MLDIDVPAGVTLWFKPQLEGPVDIEFEATAVAEGGPNDQVSDLNVFWMASNRDGSAAVFARTRSGAFADYNDLLTYYVGLGGNRNTTTRFRRYIGDPVLRPLLPEHDLISRPMPCSFRTGRQTITLIANGRHHRIPARRPDRCSASRTPRPTCSGWFALAHHVQPSAHRASCASIDPLTTSDTIVKAAGNTGLFVLNAAGVGVYNARPLAKAP